jgi:hypothetical protein
MTVAYRNGTYIAFHADGTNIPTDSDIKYYNLIKAWTAKEDDEFYMINSHEKTSAVRDSSKKITLENRLKERLRNSKQMLLIVSKITKDDTDWVPFEIKYAVDACKLPLIICYTNYKYILSPAKLSNLWPKVLKERINNNSVQAIHIPFKKNPIAAALSSFNVNNKPKGSLTYYTETAYKSFGIEIN